MNNWLFLYFILFSIILSPAIQAQNNDIEQVKICIEQAEKNQTNLTALEQCLVYSIKQLGKDDTITALVLHHIGRFHYNNDNFKQAIKYEKKALIIRTDKLSKNSKHIDISHFLLGVSYKELSNNADSALSHLHKCAAIREKKQEDNRTALVAQELARVYESIGEFENALQYYKKALELFFKNEKENIEDIGLIYNDFGLIHHSTYQFEQAIESYENALIYYQKTPENFEWHIAECQANIANSYHQLGDFPIAIKNHQLAIDFYKKTKKNRSLAKVLNNLGVALNKKGEIEPAKIVLIESLKISLDSGEYSIAASACENLGDSHLILNEINEALNYYNQAIQYTTSNKEVNYVTIQKSSPSIVSKLDLLIYLNSKAKSLQKIDLLAALETYHTIDQLLHLLKQDLQTQQSQLFWREKAAPLYQQAAALAHQLYKKTKDKKYLHQMFQCSEKSKASILYDAIVHLQAQQQLIPEALLEKEKNIKIKIGQYEHPVANGDNTGLDSLLHYRNKHEAYIKYLEKNYPKYHQLKYKTATTSITNIQSKIIKNNQTALLEYFVTDKLIYIFVITQNDVQVHELSKTALFHNHSIPFDTLISQFHQAISTNGKGQAYLNTAYTLYQTWLEPALKNLPQTINRLIIIPDDKLHYVPFESLLTQAPSNNSTKFKKLNYLIQDYQCTYAYSASLLQQVQNMEIETKLPFLGFAPTFTDLIYNQLSVTNINKMIGGKIYTDDGNNKATLIDWKDNVQILHFGTHAAMNDKEPLNCQIWIDSTNSLTTAEIYNLPIKTELVVLSACETAIGQIHKGEGMMSLGRAFMYSGSPSVVASLWQVDDEKTQQLMDYYYKNLKEGLDKDIALHQAKLDYLEAGISAEKAQAYFNPYYWSAFVHTGNTSPIRFPLAQQIFLGLQKQYWVLLMGLGLVMGLFFWKKRESREMQS